jgi:hypothetical protein
VVDIGWINFFLRNALKLADEGVDLVIYFDGEKVDVA